MKRDNRIVWINRLLLPLLNILTAFAVTAVLFWIIMRLTLSSLV
jgi:hypothetical protein